MFKKLILLSAIIPMVVGAINNTQTTNDKIFELSNIAIQDFNTNAVVVENTPKGVKLSKSDSYKNTDAYIRYTGFSSIHEVSVKNNRYLAVRYRSNYDPHFTLRVLSDTGAASWNDFLFSDSGASKGLYSYSYWNTVVYDLSYNNARNVSQAVYDLWVEGVYEGVSFNVEADEFFEKQDAFLYISTVKFFSNLNDAKTFKGLEYSTYEDVTGPEITTEYGDTFNVTAGKKIDFTATYFDDYDGIGGNIKGVLSEGAVDTDGKLVEGNHTVTFSATDICGNTSTIVVNLVVGPKDVVAPVINVNFETLYVLTNSYNCLSIKAIDDVDGEIECEYVYSDGAINELGQFIQGNHTLTVVASDLTGNTATKTINIIVSDDINPQDLDIIDEGEK